MEGRACQGAWAQVPGGREGGARRGPLSAPELPVQAGAVLRRPGLGFPAGRRD